METDAEHGSLTKSVRATLGTARRRVGHLTGRARAGRGAQPAAEPGPEAVEWGYRLFLGREPENSATVEQAAAQLYSWGDVHRYFTSSAEYRGLHPQAARPSLSGHEPPMRIDKVEVPDLDRLLAHVVSAWTELGQTEPHYSVLSEESYRSGNVQENLDAFYETGRSDVERLVKTIRRNDAAIDGESTCLELGCGVGRVTVHLSRVFAEVIAVDVSPSHLELARQRLADVGVRNVRCVLLEDFDIFRHVERFDVFYSQIVLQHNPPPVIDVLLDRALEHLSPGGIGHFQVPSYHEGYTFDLAEYLEGDFTRQGIEMHLLPQRRIFELARRHGADVLEVLEDGCTGMRPGELSNTFLVRKRDIGP